MDTFLEAISQNPTGNLAMLLIFGGGAIVAVIAILMGAIRSTNTRKEFERSRREIAAYVAEGAMTPDEGERLLAQKPQA